MFSFLVETADRADKVLFFLTLVLEFSLDSHMFQYHKMVTQETDQAPSRNATCHNMPICQSIFNQRYHRLVSCYT